MKIDRRCKRKVESDDGTNLSVAVSACGVIGDDGQTAPMLFWLAKQHAA